MLAVDKDIYNLPKELLAHSTYSGISSKLFDVKHKYYGINSCVALFDAYLFIGNSKGRIRVFDCKSQKEMKPLVCNEIEGDKITSLNITELG